MKKDLFEWDDRKAASNLRKHGVSFGEAQAVFANTQGLEWPDFDGTEEARFLLTGMSGERLLTVVFTFCGSRVPHYLGQKGDKE